MVYAKLRNISAAFPHLLNDFLAYLSNKAAFVPTPKIIEQ